MPAAAPISIEARSFAPVPMVAQARTDPHLPDPASERRRSSLWRLWLFVGAITLLGGVVIARALLQFGEVTATPWMALLAGLTIAAGRFRIKVPGHSATDRKSVV